MEHTLLLLLFASTKFCDFGIAMILWVLTVAISRISRSQAKFCDFVQPLKGKSSTLKSTCLANVPVSRLKLLNLNRQVALRNISVLCPAIGAIVVNTCRTAAELHVGGEILLSKKGTTQGDPLAMAMYAPATLPPIERTATPGARQVWYADDAISGGKLLGLPKWWDQLCTQGPDFGYDVNAPKSWLIVKPLMVSSASEVFDDTGVQITTEGNCHFGAALGTPSFVEAYVKQKVEKWIGEVEKLSSIAATEPHMAYFAFTHGLVSRWSYLASTIPSFSPLLEPLEETIQLKFLPALTGRPAPRAEMRELLALTARLGGLGIINPCSLANEHSVSNQVSAPLVALILQQDPSLKDTPALQQQAKTLAHKQGRKKQLEDAQQLRPRLTTKPCRAIDLASEHQLGWPLHPSVLMALLCTQQVSRMLFACDTAGSQITSLPNACMASNMRHLAG